MLTPAQYGRVASLAREMLRTEDPAIYGQLLQTYYEIGMRNTQAGRRYIRADMRLVKSREAAIESFRNT